MVYIPNDLSEYHPLKEETKLRVKEGMGEYTRNGALWPINGDITIIFFLDLIKYHFFDGEGLWGILLDVGVISV